MAMNSELLARLARLGRVQVESRPPSSSVATEAVALEAEGWVERTIDVAKRLRAPVRRVLLEDSYHMITIDGERDRVAALTAEFFDSIETQSQPVPVPRSAAAS